MSTSIAGFDLAETDRLLTTTRAVRRRLDLERPVEREVLLECLGIALQAPSGGNLQPWRWLVVDDAESRTRLAELYRRAYAPYMEAQRSALREAGLDDEHPVLRSSDHLAEHLHEVPVHVIPCLLGRLPDRPSAAEMATFFGSILPAAWSFQLALRSRGLGSAFTTLHLQFEAEAAEVLGIPDTVTQVGLLPVAYSIGVTFRAASRRPANEVVYSNRWRVRT